MKNPKTRFKSLLESRCALFESMEKLLLEQQKMLEEDSIPDFRLRCDDVDRIVAELKDLDYEMARLESSTGPSKIVDDDEATRAMVGKTTNVAHRNRSLIQTFVDKLAGSRDKIKKELGDTVELSNIRGYRPFTDRPPIYIDKKN